LTRQHPTPHSHAAAKRWRSLRRWRTSGGGFRGHFRGQITT